MSTSRSIAAITLLSTFALSGAAAHAGMISGTRTDVWNADGSVVNGDTSTSGVVDGETWQIDYYRPSNFNIDGSTTLSPMAAGTYFGSSTANVFGDYFSGFGNGGFFFEDFSGLASYGYTLGGVGGYEDLTVSGDFSGGPTGSTGDLTMNWKLVEYDFLSNSYSLLDSGTFTSTGIGGFAQSTLSGDFSVSGSASLQANDWVGLFFQRTSGATGSGSHFNMGDTGITYTFTAPDIPAPAPLSLLGTAGLLLLARRRARA
ncbi:MAG: hypothetical protein ACPGUC_07420 [Gammaproteobacteria bacterium]